MSHNAKYLYYPGCSLHSTAEEFNESAQALLGAMGMEFEELSDWNCCGATPAHAASEFLTGALPLRNLVLAEQQAERWGKGLVATGAEDARAAGAEADQAADADSGAPTELLVPCAACYSAFRLAEHEVREGSDQGQELNREISAIMGRPFRGDVTVKHPLEILSRPEMADRLKGLVKRRLTGLKVACYYGCLLARPSKIVSFEENPEHPMTMDALMEAVGAEPVRWSYKTDCCGQSMSVAESGLVSELTNRIVRAAREAGAEALVTACPLCMTNLDSRQKAGAGEKLLPVFFFTELAAVALEVGRPNAWLGRHLIDPRPVLERLEARESA